MAQIEYPLVSVCVPLYNAERFIERTINSILSQSYSNFEIIICDDQSQDRSFEICRGFDDPRISLIQNKVNLGVAETRKLIYTVAQGEFIANLDADDLMYPDRLTYQVETLRGNPELHYIAGGTDIIDESDNILMTNSFKMNSEEVRALLFCRNLMSNSTIFFRREILKTVEYPNLRVAQDFLFSVLVAERFNIEIFPKVVGAYRRHNNSLTHTQGREIVNDELMILSYQIEVQYGKTFERGVLLALNDYLKRKRPFFQIELHNVVQHLNTINDIIAETDPERARILGRELKNLYENNKSASSEWLVREPGIFSLSLLVRFYSISSWSEMYKKSIFWHLKFWLKCLIHYKCSVYR